MTIPKRVLAAALIALTFAALALPPAVAAEQKTVLTYSIKDARAFLWQIQYPQSTFVTEFYGPCQEKDSKVTGTDIKDPADPYGCDRTRYNQTPGTCGTQALGRKDDAPGTPTSDEIPGGVGPSDGDGGLAKWPIGNPVAVMHGMTLGRLGSTPEAGGLASMYYVDNSARRETEAHAESDAYVQNRKDYEERCAVVDAFSEGSYLIDWIPQTRYPGPFAAHTLSRADQTPSTYNMTAFRPAVQTADPIGYPPGPAGESISIVKLWEAEGRVHGVLEAVVRAARLADNISVDLVRSTISFSSDGTEKGLKASAKTEALGVRVGDLTIPSLQGDRVFELGDDSFLGVLRPVVEVSEEGHRIRVVAPGLFLAANTPLNELPIPEDPFLREDALPGVNDPVPEARGTIGDIREEFCARAGDSRPDPDNSIAKGGCRLTLGGRLFRQQVVYVAGARLDAGVGRVSEFSLGPLPPLPPLPGFTPFTPPTITPPTFPDTPVVPPAQPVGQPRYVTRELAGSAWTLAALVAFTLLGLVGVMGRWSMRFGWAERVSHVPPFPALGWVYRAFLKG